MDDRGSFPSSAVSAEAGIPVLISTKVVGRRGLLIAALFAYLKSSLVGILSIAVWLLRGREYLERKLAEAGVSPALALTPRLAALVDAATAEGRAVYFLARRCSPLFEAVAASHPSIAGVVIDPRADGATLARGSVKLLDRFPEGYDVLVRRRRLVEAIRQAPDSALTRALAATSPSALAKDLPHGSALRELARCLRLHQCVKNVVVFVPLVLGGALTDLQFVAHTLLAFLALSLVASGTYLLNDIWDVVDDRSHWSKRERPIASGALSAATALAVALLLIPAGIALAAMVSAATCAALLLYLGLTFCYTLHLKTAPFVDGLTLASLFTIRLGIGAAAAGVPPSAWLFVFSMFLFASLSYAKRYTEISRAIVRQSQSINGRGYRPVDAPMVLAIGLSTGVGAVMIMVLYIVEEAFRSSFYGSTGWLWGFPPLMFLFIVRIWLVSARGEMMDDPVAFAIRDRMCIGLLAMLMVCFGMAWLGLGVVSG
jgi:4-hydroxybenzoate polyprenyltransferase